jgi:hypothetical protein
MVNASSVGAATAALEYPCQGFVAATLLQQAYSTHVAGIYVYRQGKGFL